MRTKLVYVLTSKESDFYLEQVLLSAFSARHHNPDAHIVLVVDQDTKSTIVGSRSKIKDYVSEIIEVNVPASYTMMQRSRYLKTSLREIVEGDFLYIDTDTIICDNLSDIDKFECSVGGATDGNGALHIDYAKERKWELIRWQCVECNTPDTFDGSPFFNGGVIYAKDDKIGHQLFSLWHSNWKSNIPKGVSRDQFPLLCANKELGWVMQEIPDVYNCQVTEEGLRCLYKAKIIHYYAMIDTNYLLGQRETLERVKQEGITDDIADMVLHGAKGAFALGTRIIIPQNKPVSETYFYQLHLSSKIGYKVVNKFSEYVYYLVKYGVKIRNRFRH